MKVAEQARGVIDWLRDLAAFARYAVVRFWNDNCMEAAAALTYTSLLSLVPLTTITVGILSAFPAFRQIQSDAQELIFESLVPQVGAVVLDYIDGFANQAGQLTAFGIIGLMITSVLLLATIEGSFNAIWRVRESRPWLIRLLSAWAVLTMTPPLFMASLSLTTQIFANAAIETRFPFWTRVVGMMPLTFEFFGFALLYRIIPNRMVRGTDALIGAAVAAVLFEVSKTGFALYLATFPIYQTIYGALATFPTFLVWLWLGWSIVLLGAVVAAALPDWRSGELTGRGIDSLPPAQRLLVCCTVLHELMLASRMGIALRRRTIYRRMHVGSSLVESALDSLRRGRFVERTTDDKWLLSRDLTTTTLYDLAKALSLTLRGTTEGRPVTIGSGELDWQIHLSDLFTRLDHLQRDMLSLPLAEVIAGRPDRIPEPPSPVKLEHRLLGGKKRE